MRSACVSECGDVSPQVGSVCDILSSERHYSGGCVFALARAETRLTVSNSRHFGFVAQRKATAAEDALEPLRRELALLKAGATSHAEVCTPRFPTLVEGDFGLALCTVRHPHECK